MKPSKKLLLKLLVPMVLINLLAACAANPSADIQKEPLRIEYTLWWGDYTILIAKELGIFEKHGVTVEPVFYESHADSYSDLAAGIVDGGLFALDTAINTNDKSPMKAVAVYDDGGVSYFIGAADIGNVTDLKGRRIGVEIGSSGELFVQEALKQGGFNLRDVTLVDVAAENISDELGETIDAGAVVEPYASEALANGANTLYKSNGVNIITPNMIVFNLEALEKRPQDIRAFLKAWFEAVDFRIANPDEANQIIFAKTGQPVEEISMDSHIYTLQENIVLFSDQIPENMVNLKVAFNVNTEFLLNLGVLRDQPDMNQFFDSSFLFQ